MRKTITRLIALCSAAASIALAGCGSGGSGTPTSTATLSGVAATGAPIAGTAYIKDSSTPARELSAPTGNDGSYSFNVQGMTPPFIVKVNWSGTSGPQSLMSFATDHGTANVHFALGGRVKGGLYGEPPRLDRLDGNGNLASSLDFRSLYATVLDRWWGLDATAVLGERFTPVSLLRA